ncbi:MAG: DUF4350 domain-containing protein [Phycisphaeraceae bacterium]|nr:DUF4350 domain-containing protein [Phycisphaeraceae bacterium]
MIRILNNRRDSLPLMLLLLLAVAIVVLVAVLAAPDTEGDDRVEPSSFFDRAWGTMAFHQLIEQRGGRAVRSGRSLSREMLESATGLVLPIGPLDAEGDQPDELAPDDWGALYRWVEEGGRLLVLNHYPYLVTDDDTVHTRGRRRVSTPRERMVDVDPNLEHEVLRGVGELNVSDRPYAAVGFEALQWPNSPDERTIVRDTDDRAILAIERFGRGWVIHPISTYGFSNYGMRYADNPVLAFNVATFLAGDSVDGEPGGRVIFSEFHLGYRQVDDTFSALFRLMFSPTWRWALVQLILCGVLALLMAGWRMGRPLAVPPVRRRRQGSLADAASVILARTADLNHVLTIVRRYHRRDICLKLGLPPTADDQSLADAMRQRFADLEWAWRPLVSASEAADLREDAALKCVQGFHLILEKLK